MGSLEDEKLVQMIHDFIEAEPASPLYSSPSNRFSLARDSKLYSLQEILSRGTKAEDEVVESVMKHLSSIKDVKTTTALRKWLVTKLKTDGFNASLCQTSWDTSLGCPAGDYEYIEVMVANKRGERVRLIVDIDFGSQFELARPTRSYQELLEALPSIFVGDEGKLNKIISILCSAAKQSFKERGLHIPPWRTITYIRSKWFSGCRKVSSHSSFGRENKEAKNGGLSKMSKWVPPPLVEPKKRIISSGGGVSSALSSQFNNLSINCC